tara:strand:- start:330 stop:5141 length:4812 start_codon:yes stop_codon:yes gene_type:complete
MPRLSKIGAAALAAFGWTSGSAVTASYLQVAGGGGGGFIAGGNRGAGGGAGGLLTGTVSLNPTLSYTIVVGAGGTPLANGSNSTITGTGISVTASVGGGAGGCQNGPSATVGANGGSGGGGASQSGTGSTAAGTGTSGQGNDGAAGSNVSGQPYGCGGGGGAGAAGSLSNNPAGAGGVGVASSISGTSTYYAGGGGGGTYGAYPGAGGAGGNGGGGTGGGSGGNSTSGTANLGGGGGGAEYSQTSGSSGGSGVVIISYVGAQQFGGGVVTSSGGNTIHTFTTSGTLSPLSSLTASYLVVAGGGGGGGSNGGGGAGGLLSGSGLTIDTNSIYAVTVGAGGTAASASAGGNGGNSSFSMVSTTAVGGGGGGYQGGTTTGASGGSGGGGSYSGSAAGGTGTAGQGNNGGSGIFAAVQYGGGGGGGASAAGANGTSTAGGNGGAGTASSISGSSVTYAGGGGGGTNTANVGSGGAGGGGAGGANSGVGTAGTANTGGGGGGGATTGAANFSGGAGGSGIVIISYSGTTQQMAGGTVTVAGGNVIHTFTSSGYLTPIVLTTNSLRFRASASAYLNRTPTVASNQKTFTISFWSKLGQLGTYRSFFSAGTANPPFVDISLQNTDEFQVDMSVSAGRVSPKTTAVFRDPSAWYHFVVAFDTTQATQADRVKVYVNGVQQTITATGVAQNTDLAVNSVVAHNIGRRAVASDSYLDGYMTDINFIDGQALTPNSFGTSNGLGVWQPIRYGGSYGTNGFYLPFTPQSSISASYLVVAGGGSGQGSGFQYVYGGGGGAGGLLTGTTTLSSASSYVITVGAGIAGNSGTNAPGNPGNNTTAFGLTAVGGGGLGTSGGNGGSGAGGGSYLTATPGSGTVGQGNNGGAGTSYGAVASGGGGGGAGSAGTAASSGTAGAGGAGVASSISGSSVTYAGGGGGGGSSSGGAGGSGGGGAGAAADGNGTNGATNRGSGGGAAATNSGGNQTGGAGGSGIVIVSYAGTPQFTGGTITQSGGNTIHTFTSSGTLLGNIANDFSPQGNNWTTNNISLTSGSTYDSMTDVPTLTSATTANYCVLNGTTPQPTGWGAATAFSSANLIGTMASAGADGPCYGTITLPRSGKWYWEVIITNSTVPGAVGVSESSMRRPDGTGPICRMLYSGGGTGVSKAYDGSTLTGSYTFFGNATLGVACDMDNGKLFVSINGTYVNSGDPVAGTGAIFTDLLSASPGGGSWLPLSFGYNGHVHTHNYGQQPFTYTLPTGYVRLNTFNLPTPTIGATASTTANDYFDVKTWSGNSSTQSIPLEFAPGLIWNKSRSAASGHSWWDVLRGTGAQISCNQTDAETTGYNAITSFSNNAINLGADNTGSFNGRTNETGRTYVGWVWNAGGSTVTNTSGSISSQVRANTTAGFSIVTYTGNGTAGATIGHGLGAVPTFIIVKNRSSSQNWLIYSSVYGANMYGYLNLQNGWATDTTGFNNVTPTSTVFTVGTALETNGSTNNLVAYCFTPIAGYSAFGSYTGNGSTDGPFIFTGFRPRFIILKRSNTGGDAWIMMDTSTQTYNVVGNFLQPSQADAELTTPICDFLSNGFKLRETYTAINSSGSTYIYMAFAENPFKYANAR